MAPHELHAQGKPEQPVTEIDLEALAKAGKSPPAHEPHHQYKIRIDKVHHTITSPTATGRELLTLAGKQPVERYRLYQKVRGSSMDVVGLDETVNLTKPGLEHFKTLPLDQTEG